MFVKKILSHSNPFFNAFINSDTLGKGIFIALILLSIVSWIIILFKVLQARTAESSASSFSQLFQEHKYNPLNIEYRGALENPFYALYRTMKKYAVEILNKNRRFAPQESATSYLSKADLAFIENHVFSEVTQQIKHLEKNLFLLSTIVSLAPFLGLLGTVWGILMTFSELHGSSGSAHQMVLGGLSMALATTVLGLIDAIPALVGYNYLKNRLHDFEMQLENFANEILASVEMQYRRVDTQ
ncbi:MotA/TolQ/ExbB proton channel family protein [Parachlamydia sp. AcF125]|uniref:MotA/TolQ/ExbB proton channel family protein n=1 Tax=Parachlamydia sp. AcF125 TaxID=2795736 RepID=UPI001BC96830|nr:MotA/TolQ/ExbB proton channel family protein [Parachlamydia sp. AcF125]MBS4167741.1 Protein TolQ [Parachlamydia sp. AcF125]